MKIFIKLLKNKNLMMVAGVILIIMVIFVYGARYRVPRNTRLLAVVILLFIVIIYLQIKQLQARRGAAKLEESIQAQADEQKVAMRPEKREEIEALKQELTLAIESLKKSKLGKGHSGKAALYALPWYMFIGPPAAGKTTAIRNSGLEFPSGSDIKGIGGTRNCDWFFSNSAILLDTAGRYTTEDEDRQEWHAFLDILKKYRTRQPINGVIVGMSITDLLKAAPDEIEWHARNIRKRIDELVKRLDTRFPVYLVFTKCDLIRGFVELFENLSRKEREQIWGCTLSREQQKKMNPREVFEKEFQLLVQSLNDYRLQCFSHAVKPEKRGKVFIFPLEFNALKENLGHFVNKLFQPNPYQESPFFRGFYFTSGTQEGVPIDRVIEAISRQFGLPPETMTEPEVEKKSYFINKLFTDIIIPDRSMVVQTTRAASRRSFVRIGTVAASAVVLGLFIFWVSQAFVGNKIRLNAVKSAAESMQKVDWGDRTLLNVNFQNITRLSNQLETLEGPRPLFSPPGIYKGKSLLIPTRELYYRKLNAFVDRLLYRTLESHLEDYQNDVPHPWEVIRNYLGAYLLMDTEKELLKESKFEEFLCLELEQLLEERQFPFVTFEDQEDFRLLVKDQIAFFVKNLNKEGSLQFVNKPDLIEDVRIRLVSYGRPSFEVVYDRIKNKGYEELPVDFTLIKAVGEEYGGLITCDFPVPGFFTKDGWEQFVAAAIEKESKDQNEWTWILGELGRKISPELQDERMIKENLLNLYWREYAQHWRKFLQSIRYRSENSLASMAQHLNLLGHSTDSPLNPLLNRVMSETKFIQEMEKSASLPQKVIVQPAKKIFGGEKKKEAAQELESLRDIDRQFRALHALVTASESGESGELQNILSKYSTIGMALEGMQEAPAEAVKYAAMLLESGAGDLPEALKAIGEALKEVDAVTRRNLFEQPVKNAWEIILREAQSHLDSLWRTQVYNVFQSSLANFYPFSSSVEDAPIEDVVNFFKKPDGVLWTFVETHLKPFVRTETWGPKTWQGRGIRLSPSIASAFRDADNIHKGFIGKELPLDFMLEPAQPETDTITRAKISKISISIDGKEHVYEMGGIRGDIFMWPASQGTPGAKLKVHMRETQAEPPPLEFPGVWGWFRLLQEATIEPEGSAFTKFKLTWEFERAGHYTVKVIYRLETNTAMNPFRNLQSFFRFSCPVRLY